MTPPPSVRRATVHEAQASSALARETFVETDGAPNRPRDTEHHLQTLEVWEHNPRANASYRKAGFSCIGTMGLVVGSDVQNDLVLSMPLAPSALGPAPA